MISNTLWGAPERLRTTTEPVALAGALQCADEHAEARGVDERHLAPCPPRRDVPGVAVDQIGERLLELGHRGDVELTARDHARIVALAHLETRDVLHLV